MTQVQSAQRLQPKEDGRVDLTQLVPTQVEFPQVQQIAEGAIWDDLDVVVAEFKTTQPV